MTRRTVWRLLAHDPPAAARLASAVRSSPVVGQLLLNRGLADPAAARAFLDAPLSALHPPGLLPGVPAATAAVAEAVVAGRRICVYGDYDADGVTGTAILLRILRAVGADPQFYLPHRLGEGYGLNAEAVRKLAADGIDLLVTVDCGIASPDEADEARRLGLDLIVTDHHEPKARLPDAVLVHPRLPGSQYPFPDLSGAGVALKLAWALAQRVSRSGRVVPALREVLMDAVGLAAVGLVADVVPLRGENRLLVRHGLARMTEKPLVGVKAVIDAAKAGKDGPLTAEDIAFKLAPRLNAAGRLGCARLAVDLLTTPHPPQASAWAADLEARNAERQAREREIVRQAEELVEADGLADAPAIVLGRPAADWHPGVIGIVAGRLAARYARPVLIAAVRDGDEVSPGSGRSIKGFPLHEALAACDGELVAHGGHAAAAGFQVRPSRLAGLRERFLAEAAARFPDGPPPPVLELDAEVPLSALTHGLLSDIDKLEPYGQDNPRPRFLAAGLTVDAPPRRIGQGERHLSFRVRQGGTSVRAVAWGMGGRLDELMSGGGQLSAAFTPKINTWNGQRAIEVEVADFQPTATPVLG